MSALLALDRIGKSFDKLVALADVSLTVESGSIAGIIGPNGAGKSTVFNVITGVCAPDRGTVGLDGIRIDRWPTYRIAAAGIARTFQNIRLFAFMPSIDNVVTGANARLHANMADSLLHSPRQRREERSAFERAHELLGFVGLKHVAGVAARSLSYGEQRRLELARALASEPKLLLLDEPAAGMNAGEKHEMIALIREIRERGIAVLLIEHDMGLVMQLCEHITVLDYGEVIARGSPSEVRTNPRVVEAYLGVSA
jgi:branched-chain amino acid transport system ATP-binding protein